MRKTSGVKKQSKSDLCREWGLSPTQHLRYTGIAGIYWVYLSRQIRQEDFNKYGGRCVSCPRRLESWQDGDCGHFVASGDGGFGTRFLRQNLALQCKRCNNPSWCPDAPAFFALEVDKRWGAGTAERILNMKGQKQKEMKKEEYIQRIMELPSYLSTMHSGVPNKGVIVT